jgi:hypothetical protein
VKEAIMTDINNLVQKFWRTSSDGVVGASFFEMRRLLEFLQKCCNLEVCFDIISVFATAVNLADKSTDVDKPQLLALYFSFYYSAHSEIRAKFKILFDGYRKMFDQSFSKFKDLDDMLRFLPGVVVQNHMSMQGMADLYRIKPDLLERLIKFTIEQPRPSRGHAPYPRYILDDYLSGFLQDRDRSHLYYCDPILQHISNCRHFLSLLARDGPRPFSSLLLRPHTSTYF